ncbi:MAG: hypothetical protein QW035_04595 [Candidatus Anstonellales archaeon]
MVKLRFSGRSQSVSAFDSQLSRNFVAAEERSNRPFLDMLTVKLAKEGYSNMPLAMQLSSERISFKVAEGKIYLPDGWESKWQARKIAVSALLEFLGKTTDTLKASDLREHGLGNVLAYYSNNMEKLKKDLELEDEGASKRRKAVQEMVSSLGKKPEEITIQDFKDAGLFYMLAAYYGGSPYLALIDAGYEVEEWKMKNAPKGTWDKKENLAKAIIWLKEQTGKEVSQLTASDFHEHGLGGLITKYGGVSAVFSEVGLKIVKDLPQKKERGFWSKRENILKAVKKLEESTGKDRFSLTYTDFVDGGLRGLLKSFGDNLSNLKAYLMDQSGFTPEVAKFKDRAKNLNEHENGLLRGFSKY